MQEQVWTWVNDGDEYFYDKNEWVRVRVEGEQWTDISPSPPSERGNESIIERKSPYSITVSAPPLEKRNALNKKGFDVAVWPWASRVVVGRWSHEFSGLTSRKVHISGLPWDHEKAASIQTEHLRIKNFECILFTNSIGQVRRTMSCLAMSEECRWQRHYWDFCLLDLQAFMTNVTELLL